MSYSNISNLLFKLFSSRFSNIPSDFDNEVEMDNDALADSVYSTLEPDYMPQLSIFVIMIQILFVLFLMICCLCGFMCGTFSSRYLLGSAPPKNRFYLIRGSNGGPQAVEQMPQRPPPYELSDFEADSSDEDSEELQSVSANACTLSDSMA